MDLTEGWLEGWSEGKICLEPVGGKVRLPNQRCGNWTGRATAMISKHQIPDRVTRQLQKYHYSGFRALGITVGTSFKTPATTIATARQRTEYCPHLSSS